MSGTSGDGLDIAHCTFIKDGAWKWEIDEARTVEFHPGQAKRLANAHELNDAELRNLDVDFGHWMGKQVREFITEFELSPVLVASHGHTVFHQPEDKKTLQIGDGDSIRKECGLPVVFDFRTQDVNAGGQGAPLAPCAEQYLFNDYKVCVNLGGFANMTFLGDENRYAYDISPCNIILNRAAAGKHYPFDLNGDFASKGTTDEGLKTMLDSLPYYQQAHPKSLGREWVESNIWPLMDESGLTTEDLLSTLTDHVADRVIQAIKNAVFLGPARILLTGGGVYNKYLVDRIREGVAESVEIEIPEDQLINFKESLVFAFLGMKRMNNEVNVFKEFTGASKDSISGRMSK